MSLFKTLTTVAGVAWDAHKGYQSYCKSAELDRMIAAREKQEAIRSRAKMNDKIKQKADKSKVKASGMSASETVGMFFNALQRMPKGAKKLKMIHIDPIKRIIENGESLVAHCGDSKLKLLFGRYLGIAAAKALLFSAQSANIGEYDNAVCGFNMSSLWFEKSFRFRLKAARTGCDEALKEFKDVNPQKRFQHNNILNVENVIEAILNLAKDGQYSIKLPVNDKEAISLTTKIQGFLPIALGEYAIYIPLSKRISNIDDLCKFISNELGCVYEASVSKTLSVSARNNGGEENNDQVELRRCSLCGATISAKAKFCSECGTPLVWKCVSCGIDLKPEMKFCPECGAKV